MIRELLKPFVVELNLSLPGRDIYTGQLGEFGFGHRESSPVDVLEPGHPAEVGFRGSGAAANPVNDPL